MTRITKEQKSKGKDKGKPTLPEEAFSEERISKPLLKRIPEKIENFVRITDEDEIKRIEENIEAKTRIAEMAGFKLRRVPGSWLVTFPLEGKEKIIFQANESRTDKNSKVIGIEHVEDKLLIYIRQDYSTGQKYYYAFPADLNKRLRPYEYVGWVNLDML